jgi:hypothetical protein
MNDKEKEERQNLLKLALEYFAERATKNKEAREAGYPLNRGDLIVLVMLIEQQLRQASADWTDPLNAKRLTAIREKLGDIAGDAPQMSRAEAQQFRE